MKSDSTEKKQNLKKSEIRVNLLCFLKLFQHQQKNYHHHNHRSKHRHHLPQQQHQYNEEARPSHGHKLKHRPKSQEHLINPELAAEILQKCLLSLSDQQDFVLQKIAQQHLQRQTMDHTQPIIQHQIISHPQTSQVQHHVELPQRQSHRNKKIRASSSTATSPC